MTAEQVAVQFAIGLQNIVPRAAELNASLKPTLAALQHVNAQRVADIVKAGERVRGRSTDSYNQAQVAKAAIIVERIDETCVLEQFVLA